MADVEQVAKALNITPRRVQQLVGEGLPRASKGDYDLGAAMVWYIRFLQRALEQRGSMDGGGNVMALAAERARLAREQADKTSLENAVRRGELAEIAAIAEEFGKAIAAVRARLLAVPTKEAPMLAPLSDANSIKSRLTTAIREALTELASFSERHARTSAARGRKRRNGAVRAAAGSDGKSVGRQGSSTKQ